MADDILSQEEIDALLHGVDDGEVEIESDESGMEGEFSTYDLTSQDRIVRGRMPTLEMINERLKEMDVKLHLSEVKGPVMDRLKQAHFLQEMTGRVFLSQFEAAKALRL